MTKPIIERYTEYRFKDIAVRRTIDSVEGYKINPDASPDALEAKSPVRLCDLYPNIDEYRTIPTNRFYDKAVMAEEWEHLWTKVWLCAGRVSDIANVGDWLTYQLGNISIVVVRSEDGNIRAFHNVCRHRGNILVRGDFGNARDFTCGFHSWRWNTEGHNTRVTDWGAFTEDALRGSLDLPSVATHVFAGFVWISLAASPMPFDEYLGEFQRTIASFRLDEMKVMLDVQITVPANWKVAANAFQEAYHVHAQHPQNMLDSEDLYQTDCYPNGHSRQIGKGLTISDRWRDRSALTPVLKTVLQDVGLDPADFEGRPDAVRGAVRDAKRAPDNAMQFDYSGFCDSQLTDNWIHTIFPNITTSILPEGAQWTQYRPHPTDPEQCIYSVFLLARSDIKPPARMEVNSTTPRGERPPRQYATLEQPVVYEILQQDLDSIPFFQRGLRSPSLPFIRLSEQEQRLQQFHAEIDLYLRGEKGGA